ncbi:hypothetical protein MMB19_14410 [Ralstonia insidiosa]|nr:hypothetical protein MMB19_14410 [Ralstonia insidiosa]
MSLAAAFTIGAIVAKFKALTNEVQDNALAMGKLAKQTGLSTDAIQVYMKAAGPSAAAQEALTKGLQKFSITAGQAELGSKKMTIALGEMGVKSSDFSKMNMDEKLQTLTTKLAGIEDPAQRAAIAVTFFGKGAQGMLAALDKVAHEGFDTLLSKLKEMGLYLDRDTIAAMARVKRDMKEMGETSKGLATQFLTGLMPAVSDAMSGIVRDTNKGASGFLILGQKVGWAVDVVAQGMRLIGTAIGEPWQMHPSGWSNLPMLSPMCSKVIGPMSAICRRLPRPPTKPQRSNSTSSKRPLRTVHQSSKDPSPRKDR